MLRAEHAIAIRAFDYLAAVLFGVAAAVSAWYLIPESLPPPLAMLGGMGIGMMSAFPLLALLSVLLGGFEILVMSMQIGMLAGMIGVGIGDAATAPVVVAGAASGLTIQLLLHVADRRLHGQVGRHD